MHSIMYDPMEQCEKMLGSLGIVSKGEDKNLMGKSLRKRTMYILISVAETRLSVIVTKVLSSRVAQKYSVENLYEDPMDNDVAKATRNCETEGALMRHASKILKTSVKGRFSAFGQVFSGTIATGEKVSVQGPYYKPGTEEDMHMKNI